MAPLSVFVKTADRTPSTERGDETYSENPGAICSQPDRAFRDGCGTDDSSVPPLPSVDIFVGDVGYRGELAGYSWPSESMPEEAVAVCADPKQGVFPAEEVLAAGGMKLRVVVDSVSPPTRLTANVYADPTMPAIQQINITNEVNRELDVDFVARGEYYVRVHGEWPEGQADYGFRNRQVTLGDAFTAECMY